MRYSPTIENEAQLKREFAEGVLRNPSNPFAVAMELFPKSPSIALWVSQNWIKDPEIKERQKQLLEERGANHFLPSKVDLSWHIWERLQNCYDPADYAKLAKLYAEVQGMIDKSPGPASVSYTHLTLPTKA